MSDPTAQQVAVFIDFENLVRGIGGQDGLDCELLLRLAEESGRVLVANAYADWRMKDVNQYQTDLYRLGVDLVHVFGRVQGTGFKNAVDVKMAVDAITTLSTLPHIDVFVIVSGDRDFIHVLKALRRHGKTIVGVSAKAATSNDFAALCDRFVAYESLASAYQASGEASLPARPAADGCDLDEVRRALKSIVQARPEGIKGAMIKPLLRRELSPTFDESAYGFARLTDLLRRLNDVVKLAVPPDGGDVLVYPASAQPSPQGLPNGESRIQRLIRAADLSWYRYEPDCQRRRSVLTSLYDAMAARPSFTWDEVQNQMLAEVSDGGRQLSVTVLARYKTIIYHGRGFEFEPNQIDRPQRERLMHLRRDINSADALIRLYEGGVAYKILAAADDEVVTASDLAAVLGLSGDGEQEQSYCQQLLAIARSINGQDLGAAAPRSSDEQPPTDEQLPTDEQPATGD